MRTTFLLPALAAICSTQAQQISGYRYWFDDNAAGAVTTSVGATDELMLAANWPTGSMEPGYHQVSIQVRDSNGDWSVPRTSLFTRGAQVIIGYRYWVNDNVSNITTGSIGPNMEVNLSSLIDPGILDDDFNAVTIQFKGADDEWSVPMTSWFVKNTGAVDAYEYWIDDAIANSTTNSIGPNGVVDLIADLPTGVPAGTHFFTIRFRGTNGTWSVPLTTQFTSTVGISELPGISELVLFPNPVTDALSVRVNTTEALQLDLVVMDAQGRVARNLPSWTVSGSTYRNWDISDLASGSYVLRISDEKGTRSLPFVKP